MNTSAIPFEATHNTINPQKFHSQVHRGLCLNCSVFDIQSPVAFLKTKNGKDIKTNITDDILETDLKFDPKRHKRHHCSVVVRETLLARQAEEAAKKAEQSQEPSNEMEDYVKKFNEKYGI